MTSRAAVTLLWGEDPYLLRERALELVDDRRPTEVDANEWRGSELQDLATPSLFGESRGVAFNDV
jgi:DNA polymerase III delta subunit